MRAIWWRELRELSIVGLGVVIAMAALGADWALRDQGADAVALFGLVGAGLGGAQGLLDRRRRADAFLHHRPVSAWAIHGGRSVAGLTLLLVGAVSFGLGIAYERRRWEEFGHLRYFDSPARDFEVGRTMGEPIGGGPLLLFASVTLAGWAAVRWTAALRRSGSALLASGAVVITGWSFVARTATTVAASGVAAGVLMVCAMLTTLDAVGERR